MRKAEVKQCQGCNQKFTLSTAVDEQRFCSEYCEKRPGWNKKK